MHLSCLRWGGEFWKYLYIHPTSHIITNTGRGVHLIKIRHVTLPRPIKSLNSLFPLLLLSLFVIYSITVSLLYKILGGILIIVSIECILEKNRIPGFTTYWYTLITVSIKNLSNFNFQILVFRKSYANGFEDSLR